LTGCRYERRKASGARDHTDDVRRIVALDDQLESLVSRRALQSGSTSNAMNPAKLRAILLA
jgi:hypothetical protein